MALRLAWGVLILCALLIAPGIALAQASNPTRAPAVVVAGGYTFMRDFSSFSEDLNLPVGVY